MSRAYHFLLRGAPLERQASHELIRESSVYLLHGLADHRLHVPFRPRRPRLVFVLKLVWYTRSMITQAKKYSISFTSRATAKRVGKRGFYELAKRHIVKGKQGGRSDLSMRIDEVAYGV